MEEEEEHHGEYTQRGDDHGEAHKDGGSPECRRLDGGKVIETTLADEVLTILEKTTGTPEAKVSSPTRGGRVTEPLWLNKDNRIDDGKAEREDGPENTDGTTVAAIHNVTVVHVHVTATRITAKLIGRHHLDGETILLMGAR